MTAVLSVCDSSRELTDGICVNLKIRSFVIPQTIYVDIGLHENMAVFSTFILNLEKFASSHIKAEQ